MWSPSKGNIHMHYQNPIIPGFYPDPSICRVGEDYYLVNSSFEYFPGVPVFHSRDLVHWRQIGHCLTRPSQLPLGKAWSSEGIYAPTIRYHQGVFYMTTTNVSEGGHFYVHTQDPAGEWSEPLWVDQEGIDPSLFFSQDGMVYFTSQGRQGITQSVIDVATGQRLTEPRVIWTGSGAKSPEGPHLYQIHGRYYLLVAEGGTEYGHMETIARSDSPWGPFENCPRNPILTHRSTGSPIQATGHGDLVQAPDGSWWMVFLGVRPHGYPPCYHLGRETFLAPVVWAEACPEPGRGNGWPVVGQGGQVSLEMEADGLPTCSSSSSSGAAERDDFDSPSLRLCWNFVRNPHPEDWSLAGRPGWLRLTGSAFTLSDKASPAFVGQRQCHFECRAATYLEFDPQVDGEEAGLVARMNERHHYEIAVTRRDGVRCVIVRRRIGTLQAVVAQGPLEPGPVQLEIAATHDQYTFSYAQNGQSFQPLASGETRYLSTEVAGGFTGVYLAMYATGNGRPCTVPAYFDWFDYKYDNGNCSA